MTGYLTGMYTGTEFSQWYLWVNLREFVTTNTCRARNTLLVGGHKHIIPMPVPAKMPAKTRGLGTGGYLLRFSVANSLMYLSSRRFFSGVTMLISSLRKVGQKTWESIRALNSKVRGLLILFIIWLCILFESATSCNSGKKTGRHYIQSHTIIIMIQAQWDLSSAKSVKKTRYQGASKNWVNKPVTLYCIN